MLFSWCCRWFFPITSPAVQELDRKVTMAEQIATIRYRMNAFMFWFMIFFCPLLSIAFPLSSDFSYFLRFLLEEVLCETTRFEAWSLGFITLVCLKSLAVRIVAVVLFFCAPSFSFRGLFIFPIREIFFSNWASDFARFLNHDAKIRNPDLSGVR